MKKLIFKSLIALVPILLWLIIFVLFEPFNYFGVFKEPRDYNTALPRMAECKNNQHENFLYGDSRMAYLDTSYIQKITGDLYLNMAFGGSSLNERIDLFYYTIQKQKTIKKIFFQIDWWTFNQSYSYDRVEAVKTTINNPFEYLFNLDYNSSAAQNLIFFIRTNKFYAQPVIKNETVTEEESLERFTKHINEIVRPLVEGFIFSKDNLNRLVDVAKYCNNNNIELVFIVPPYHELLWDDIIEPYNIEPFMYEYKRVLSQYAPVYDFEYRSGYINQTHAFRDSFHLDGMATTQSKYHENFNNSYPLLADYISSIFIKKGKNMRIWENGSIVLW